MMLEGLIWNANTAPWVDLAHSRTTSMQMAQYLPTKAFALWHRIPRFFITQATPVLATSGALIRQIPLGKGGTSDENQASLDANSQQEEHDYGISRAKQAELFRLTMPFMFDENTVGANSEALQCLRKSDGSDWGACSDYAQCAQMLASREQAIGTRVSVRAYFASTDALVGHRGQRYFEQCWQAPGLDAIDFTSMTMEKTDHDTVMQSVEVWSAIFASVPRHP